MKSFRFIHTADIHLDSPLRGLPEHGGQLATRIRGATRDAFEGLIGVAIDERVDFLVVAGDLYDGEWRDYQTGLFLVAQMARLRDHGIPAFLLHGNHDFESPITKRLQLPDNVRVFSSRRPETFHLEALGVALHGRSFPEKAVHDNLAATYPAPFAGLFNIGVLHTALGVVGPHAPYAPCTLPQLVNHGYDYWALGHVHGRQVHHEHPHVVFPGNLQGRHINERGEKSASLVTVEDGVITRFETVSTDVVRWTETHVDVADCDRLGDIFDRIQGALEQSVKQEADGRLLATRVRFHGETALHGELAGARTQLLAETWAAALGLGEERAWIERLVLDTAPLPVSGAVADDAVAELTRILADAGQDLAFVASLADDVSAFVRKFPAEARFDVEDPLLRASLAPDGMPTLIDGASEYLLGRLGRRGA